MVDLDPTPEPSDHPEGKPFPWVGVAIGAVFLLMAILALWLTKTKPNEQARLAVVQTLEKELDLEKEALEAQRNKVLDLTTRLEGLKQAIQLGTVDDGKKAIEEYNKLAAQQRAERETFKTLANQYNEKIAQLRKLQ